MKIKIHCVEYILCNIKYWGLQLKYITWITSLISVDSTKSCSFKCDKKPHWKLMDTCFLTYQRPIKNIYPWKTYWFWPYKALWLLLLSQNYHRLPILSPSLSLLILKTPTGLTPSSGIANFNVWCQRHIQCIRSTPLFSIIWKTILSFKCSVNNRVIYYLTKVLVRQPIECPVSVNTWM